MVPEVAEELAAEEVDAFAEVDGGVLFEGVVEALDGATPRAWEGRWCWRFL